MPRLLFRRPLHHFITGSPVNSSVVQFLTASGLTQMAPLPRCLSEALYSLQLRMQKVGFFFMAEKAYHVTASAHLHSDSCNKAVGGGDMPLPSKHYYEFCPYRLDLARRLLLREGEVVSLTSKVFDLLLLLVESSGRVLEKDELMTKLWPDTIVEEANLSVYVSTLRKALGERPGEHRYIATIPGQGYCFVAEVKECRDGKTELAQEDVGVISQIEKEGENVEA